MGSDRPPLLRLAIGHGALAGVALGYTIVAPRLLAAHHLTPSSLGAWVAVFVFTAVLFSVLGALLGIYAALPVFVAARRTAVDDDALSARVADSCVALLPFGYLGLALVLEMMAFGAPLSAGLVAGWSAGWGVMVGLVWILSRGRRRSGATRRRPRRWLAATAVLAAALLPLSTVPRPNATPAPALRRATAAPPLLFVGIDGASWTVLEPLLSRGRLPTLGKLARQGAAGNVANPHSPHWSAPAWATIATGAGAGETGVYEDLAATAPWIGAFEVPLVPDPLLEPTLAGEQILHRLGLIDLHYHERSALRATPFWERVSAAGDVAAVIGFPFTHPAEGVADVVVSNWLGEDLWTLSDLRRDDGSRGVAPRDQAAFLLEPFRTASPAEVEARLRALVADRTHVATPDKLVDPLQALEIATAIDWRTFAAAERALALRRDARLLAVYLRGLDGVSHAFWSYRFPEAFAATPPAPSDVAALGGVLDRYWEFLDEGLGRLVSAFPEPPNVVVIADHGFEPVHGNGLWSGWHAASGGVFMAGGPSVMARPGRPVVNLADVAPTALALLGFAPPADLVDRHPLVGIIAPRVAAAACGCDKGFDSGSVPCSASAENC